MNINLYKRITLTKFKLFHKFKINQLFLKKKNYLINFGYFGIKTLYYKRLKINLLEIVRRTILYYGGRRRKFWIKYYPNISVSRKPKHLRMGKGKGEVSYQIINLCAGMIPFELG
jgi:large subunit ribosomal protein L16